MPTWEQLEPYLRTLAEQLGTTSSNLWAILVQRQIVAGYQDLLWAAVWGFTYIIPFLAARLILRVEQIEAKEHEQKRELWDGSDYKAWAVFIYIVGGIIVAIPVVIQLNMAITHFASPEYSALQALMSMLGKK